MPDDQPPSAAAGPDETGEVQFYIPATSSLLERRPRTLKHDDTFAMFDHYGDIFAGERTPEGLFHDDTRFLSRYQLTLNGRRPLLLGSSVQDDNALLSVDLTNPDTPRPGHRTLRKDSIHVLRSKFIWQAACYERLAFHNFGAVDIELLVTLDFDADFFDLFQVRGEHRSRHGALSVATSGSDTAIFSYRGLDGLDRRTSLHFDPSPENLAPRQASFRLRLPPGGRRALFVTIRCTGAGGPTGRTGAQPHGSSDASAAAGRPFFHALRRARRPLRAAGRRQTRIETSNAVFNEVLHRSSADLAMLTTATAYGPYPYAGIPWFSTAFGRDGILTAVQMLWVNPEMARGVLRYLARTQAQADDAAADAEPGKILHETRAGEMARLGEVPFGKYYGTIDATPLFVVLAGLYWQRTLDFATIEALWPHITAALAWIDANAARHPDGLIAYRRRRDGGLANQGWKDSEDSIFHADGRLAEPPIALAEVQGYAWHARVLAAKLARRKGEPALAAHLDEQAEELRRQVEARFWCEGLGTYALAIDGSSTPCRVRSSNAGHLLWSGLPSRQRAAQVADMLLAPSMFSGWGVRTVATGEARYNPMSYHDGSVWPHDNAVIALGLARYGQKEAVLRLLDGIFAAATYMDLRRLPELICGFKRQAGQGPTAYPVACAPQAWASATPFALLQAALGLELDAGRGVVRFHKPRLPASLDRVTLRGLALGTARLDLLLQRTGPAVAVTTLARHGDVRLQVEL